MPSKGEVKCFFSLKVKQTEDQHSGLMKILPREKTTVRILVY